MSWAEIKKARLRLGREQGTIVKDWGGRIPVALVYPNSYYLGMSNLGVHTIYDWLNSQPDIVCERVFIDNTDGELSRPPLSVESQRPLTHFAVLAFSITYELDYFNVPRLLRSAGIPVRARERDETHPLVISGGACMTANPIPLSHFFDAICVGEAEAILPQLLPVLRQGSDQSMNRHEALSRLSKVPGIYVPLHPTGRVSRQWAGDLDDFPVHSAILTPDTELGDM